VPGVRFYSLQVGYDPADPGAQTLPLTALAPLLGDFADTAAAIARLDLVICVDTAVAHLAGALGKPVWILLPHAPDWRWGRAGNTSPWYPSARLFRQAAPGQWGPLMQQVAAALQEVARA
jgi:ADP-heptose:LPS heptosyltransferase